MKIGNTEIPKTYPLWVRMLLWCAKWEARVRGTLRASIQRRSE